MSPQPESLSKAEIRSRCRSYRKQISLEEQSARSDAILKRMFDSDIFADHQVIHVYWPIITQGEIDTRALIHQLHESGKTVVIPSEENIDPYPTGRMSYRVYRGPDQLKRNVWGSYQPSDDTPVPLPDVDLCVLPALAMDRRGYRIGYGGGFYDRFLNETECAAVSLVYSDCLLEIVPVETHDVWIPTIVTEKELLTLDAPATS